MYFEYIQFSTKDSLHCKIYEDGLVLLRKKAGKSIQEDMEKLKVFYEDRLSASLSYIFSLGAPIPKELADIKTTFPYFVVTNKVDQSNIDTFLGALEQERHFEVMEETYEMYRGDHMYVINRKGEKIEVIERFIEEQIFAREFKAQLHRYLNLHRIIWENIAEVKERGSVVGKEIGALKSAVERYQKTITFIDARIAQMGVYIKTRRDIVKTDEQLVKFIPVMRFKYDTLHSSLLYVEKIWDMTRTYVDSAVDMFAGMQAKATNSSIKNLTIVTAMGVGGTLINLFTKKIPELSYEGLLFFAILVAVGYVTDKIMSYIALNRSYKVKETRFDKGIKSTHL